MFLIGYFIGFESQHLNNQQQDIKILLLLVHDNRLNHFNAAHKKRKLLLKNSFLHAFRNSD